MTPEERASEIMSRWDAVSTGDPGAVWLGCWQEIVNVISAAVAEEHERMHKQMTAMVDDYEADLAQAELDKTAAVDAISKRGGVDQSTSRG